MLTMAIMAMGTLSAFAQNTLTKEYDFGKITKIEASSIFDIEVTQGNTKTRSARSPSAERLRSCLKRRAYTTSFISFRLRL